MKLPATSPHRLTHAMRHSAGGVSAPASLRSALASTQQAAGNVPSYNSNNVKRLLRKILSLKNAPKVMFGCIVSNCGTQAILRVQIDTIFERRQSFLHLLQMPENQHFSERQMHPCIGGYRFLSWNCCTFDIS